MATASSEPAGGACSPTVERFLRYMTAEKAASPLTIKSYREDLLQLEEFLQSAGCRTPAEATSPLLRLFAAGLHAAGYAPATVARKLASLRSLYAFGKREGWVRANPNPLYRQHVLLAWPGAFALFQDPDGTLFFTNGGDDDAGVSGFGYWMDGTLHHVAAQWSDGQSALYLDG